MEAKKKQYVFEYWLEENQLSRRKQGIDKNEKWQDFMFSSVYEEEVLLYRTEVLWSLLKLKQWCATCDDPESHLCTGYPRIYMNCTGHMTDEGHTDIVCEDWRLEMTAMSMDKNHG